MPSTASAKANVTRRRLGGTKEIRDRIQHGEYLPMRNFVGVTKAAPDVSTGIGPNPIFDNHVPSARDRMFPHGVRNDLKIGAGSNAPPTRC